MNPYLKKIYVDDGVRITCIGWRRLFLIQEPMYKELCFEFLSTIRFRGRTYMFDTDNLLFCLGGERRECNVAKLASRMDLYNHS